MVGKVVTSLAPNILLNTNEQIIKVYLFFCRFVENMDFLVILVTLLQLTIVTYQSRNSVKSSKNFFVILVVVDRTRIFWFGRTEPEPELKSPNPNRTRTEPVSNKIGTLTKEKIFLLVSQV